MLETLGRDYQSRQRGQGQIRSAMAWPITLMVVLMLLGVVVSSFVVPAYELVFVEYGMNLPWITRWMIQVSGALAATWWLIALVAVVLAVAVRRNGVPAVLTDAFWRVCAIAPGCQNYFARQYGARLALWVAAVGDNAALFQAALLHLQQTTAIPALRQAAAGLGEQLERGDTLAAALGQSPQVPASLLHASRPAWGKEDAEVALALCQELTQDQAALAAERLGRWIFFVSYGAVGVLTCLFVLSVYLPIFKLGAIV